MLESTIKRGFILYIFLSIFEFSLTYNSGSGSILKLYGFVLMGLWLVLFFKNSLKLERYPLYLVYFYLWMVITLLWAKWGEFSIYYIMSMGNMIVLVLIVSSLSWKRNEMSDLLKIVQYAALIFSLILIFEGNVYHGKTVRYTIMLFGQKMDPNGIAGLLLPAILISFNNLMRLKNIIFSGSTFFISVIALISTGSRGGLLALLAGMIVLVVQNLLNHQNSEVRISFKAILIITLIFIAFFKFAMPKYDEALLNRYKYSTVVQDKGSDRLDLWGRGWDLFNTRAITGIGIGGFEAATGKGLHNQFLIVLVEGGIIGFTLFLIALMKILSKSFGHKIVLAQAILVSTFTVIFFLDAYNMKFFWNGIMLAVIMIKVSKMESETYGSVTINKTIA